ncbi:NUDIX domain-containing protein [Clostridium sp. BSD9I1]|uniref:NUDIX domain-containing protein n=1 Tax=Clostridium sp. BSD9I1 TaxID=2003589 RepID=UPI001645EEC5|nr:NUDIX domain-containing protein [Clostridium sp. BSD9I1]
MIENILNNDEKIFGKKLDGVGYIDRIAVYGIVTDGEGKVAVIKTPAGYFLPGGGMENEETHKECIEREFIEETGYKIEIQKFIGRASLYHISKTKQYLRGIGYFYIVSLENYYAAPIEKDHKLIWLEPNECIKSLFLEHQAWAVSESLKYMR